MSDIVDRLRRGASKSHDIGEHLMKYQALCDEAATAIRSLTEERDRLKEQVLDYQVSISGHAADEARWTRQALEQKNAALTARVGELEAQNADLKRQYENVCDANADLADAIGSRS